ncbi:MAG: VacJ family lipoprotein [Zoogloeaceae bacterium]|jgi:phospholipid-binding lipoprotein MlaA|nr:VacJ family lipoprotein [Zoogloeaceae bacterium]
MKPIHFLCAIASSWILLMGGCASQAQRAPIAADPYEGFNRAMFSVHREVDSVVMRPLAKGYDLAVPLPAKMSVGNFFDNLRDAGRSGNALLQGKGEAGATGLARLLVNSTLGIFGLFDVASEMGLEAGNEGFAQTLAHWGAPSGPYLFLPLLGPNTPRDLAGWSVDQSVYPLWRHVKDRPALRNSLVATSLIRQRALLLPMDRLLDDASLDPYAYLRDAYLQNRAAATDDVDAYADEAEADADADTH